MYRELCLYSIAGRRHEYRLVEIPLTDEEKKHIWILILLDLFEKLKMFLLLLIFLNFIRHYCLVVFLYYLTTLFYNILIVHTGHYNACFHIIDGLFVLSVSSSFFSVS